MKKNKIIFWGTKSARDLFLFLFLFYSMFFPTAYAFIRLAFFLVVILIILIENGFSLSGKGIFWVSVLLLSNLISFAIGVMNKTPGAFRSMTVDFVWPVLFLLFSQFIKNEEEIKKVIKYMILICFIVLLFDIIYLVLSFLGKSLGPLGFLVSVLECSFGNYGQFFQYTTTHMCTLIFMLPFLIALFFDENSEGIISRKLLVTELAMGAFCLIISGRVAFVLTTAFSFLLLFFLRKYCSEKKQRREFKSKIFLTGAFGLIAFLIVSNLFLKVDWSGIAQYIIHKFTSSQLETHITNGVRKVQSKALIEGWLESMLFGHGTGSYTKTIIRMESMPWAYEYTYLAMLYQKGLVGTVIYFGFIGIVLARMIISVKNSIYSSTLVIPFILGLVAILIATAADPYLTTFGCMWMLYIPFAIANYDEIPIGSGDEG